MEKLKILVDTHTDLDGIMSGLLIEYILGNDFDVEVRHVNYKGFNNINDNVNDDFDNYDYIFITDISVDEDKAELIESRWKDKVILLDHHGTAEWLNKYSWADVIVEKEGVLQCGATLVYDFLKEDPRFKEYYDKIKKPQILHDYVYLTREYDTWEWKKNGTKDARRLNILFGIDRKKRFIENTMNKFKSGFFKLFTPDENLVVKEEERQIFMYCLQNKQRYMEATIDGLKLKVVFCENHINDIADAILEEYPDDTDIAVVINMNGRNVSFRTSRTDIKVGEIVERFDGGGHPKAGGFKFTEEFMTNFISKLF